MAAIDAAAYDQRVLHAWRRYLDATRNLIGYRYAEVEPQAWSLLQDTLARLNQVRGAA